MSRVKEAQELINTISAFTNAAQTAPINDGILDRFNVCILMDIMLSLAVIADSVNKEEKDD